MSGLLTTARIEGDVEDFIRANGSIFRRFLGHDSGCVSLGVLEIGRRFFIKYSTTPRATASLRRAVAVNRAINDALLPALLNIIEMPAGLLLVYEWAAGELIRAQQTQDFTANGEPEPLRSTAVLDRFRSLAPRQIAAVLDSIYDLHVRSVAQRRVAMQATEPNPADRFQTLREFASAWRRCIGEC